MKRMRWTLKAEADCAVPQEDILALVARSLGENWTTKSSHQLRLGNRHYPELSLLGFEQDQLVATVRIWPIIAGSAGRVLLLGPLAVDPPLHGQGLGKALCEKVISTAKEQGHRAIVLVGDAPYYERVGFNAKVTWNLRMPGRYDQNRLLGYELEDGVLSEAFGVITR